jgi:DNA-directed RNA polymerase specialized sigma24 family protein
LITPIVFTTLKPPMTEGIRRTAISELKQVPSIRQGIEGFADGMRMFPRLKEWENQIALGALREGKTVQDLRNITPFRQYLGVDRRANLASETSPFSSFTTLFALSPRIDMLISFGNFHTIRSWTWTLAKQCPHLNLPLEQFYQEALLHIVPYQARAYDPSIGNPFHHFLSEMLKKRFRTFVTTYQRETTAPIQVEEKPQSKKGKPAERRERVKIASLDAPMHHAETPHTLFEYVDQTYHTPQETTQREDQEAKDKIHLLARLAGLNEPQEETLVALYIDGSKPKQISQFMRRTTRMVRNYRQTALNKIAQLGYETVQGVLTGEYPPQ